MNSPVPLRQSWWRVADGTGIPLLAARAVLGLTFIVMGANKIQDPPKFLKDIHQFNLVPESFPTLLNLMAVVIPWLEVVCGALLILGVLLSGAGVILWGMLVVFTSAIFMRTLNVMAAEGTPFFAVKFDCGCGGGPTTIWIKLLENLGLMVLATIVVLSHSRRFCLPELFNRRPATEALPTPVQAEA